MACHRSVVEKYRRHGMSASIGPVGEPASGKIKNPASGVTYEIETKAGGTWLRATFADGGQRLQRLVGRIGAGKLDTSWVGLEIDGATGRSTGRHFFAPVETLTGRGHTLSPFDTLEGSPGLDLALTADCLTCHTDSVNSSRGARSHRSLYPANALGDGAFERLSPLQCEACHGPAADHLEAMTGGPADALRIDRLGLVRLGALTAAGQRDVCARCHLQGDARLDLVAGQVSRDRPLAGQIPVVLPARDLDDYRFVGQLERLALSRCFQRSPEMTCTTCHDPHTGVADQGVESFDATCARCHETCSRRPGLGVEEVTGRGARTAAGCVDCHVRRSEPFDLAHVESADHFIRRRVPRPRRGIPHRAFADPAGSVRIYDDGRLASALASPGGRRWQSGVRAMALASMGRFQEAARELDVFPRPGNPGARRPSAPAPLVPLETHASFHELRAMVLLANGRSAEAIAAYTDALTLEPHAPSALMGRARLRFDNGDVLGGLQDSQAVIDAHPRAEQPWELRAYMAERMGRPDLALAAFRASTQRWPSNPLSWYKLGLLLRQRGDEEGARAALARARGLKPSLRLDPGR